MSIARVAETPPAAAAEPLGDPLVSRLDVLIRELAVVAADIRGGVVDEVSDAVRVDRIGRLEQARSVVAAVQLGEVVRFARSQVQSHLDTGRPARDVGKGIGEQVGLVCGQSSHAGMLRLNLARALYVDLPASCAALGEGRISERVADLIATATSHLDAATRRAVDARTHAAGVAGLGVGQAETLARKTAYEADKTAYLGRGRTARTDRRVTLRPAPDTMANLRALLPVEQGVACYAALTKYTDGIKAAGDARSRGQIMADTLVERVIGQTRAQDVNYTVDLLLPVEALLGPNADRTAVVNGYGPIPAHLAQHLLVTSNGQKWWRRLFTAPTGGIEGGGTAGPGRRIVGGDPRRRLFTGWLAQLIRLRDQTCRDPYCDAPIRHIDHIHRHTDGGDTTYENGRGVCARGNQLHELPGWKVEPLHSGNDGPAHTIRVTTPTGHTYNSRAPDPP